MRARALMKFLWESAQFFPVLSNTVPALFISFDLKCTVRFSLKMSIFVVPFSVASVNIPSVIKNYTSCKRSFEVILYHLAGETGTKYRIVERCVFNRTMAAYSMFKFQNMNIQCYFTQKLRGSRLGNKKN